MKKILVTGAFGQIGSELVPELQKKYGADSVIAQAHSRKSNDFDGIVEQFDIRDKTRLNEVLDTYHIDTVFHLVSLLSANGEKDPHSAWDINMNGLKHVLDAAVEKKLKVFWPSSIAAFGPTTPREHTPQHTVMEPTTMYGATKVSGELLCQYYHLKWNVDVRSVRYPGIISWKTPPGGGTTDYAVAIFYDGITKGSYTCFVREDTTLPMMYMDDAVAATIQLMEAEQSQLTVHTSYNLAALSFTAKELATEIQKIIPLKVNYEPDFRQKIADSWPQSIDDSTARQDWGWKHSFSLSEMVKTMIIELRKKLL